MTKTAPWLFAALAILCFSISSTQELLYELEGIVVTATRTPERLREIPLGVSVLSSQDIELRGADDLGELLRGELGIDVRGYGPLGQTSTVSLRGSTASQVLVLVDGRPVNHVALGISDLSLLSLDIVEKIEIVRGPISSLYGANALGGVVNIITKEKPESAFIEQQVTFGSFDTELFAAEVGAKAGRVGLLVAGSSKSTQGFRSNSGYEGEGGQAKIYYGEDGSPQLSLSFGLERRKLGVPGPRPAPGESPVYGDSTATSLFDSQKDRNLSGDLSLRLPFGQAAYFEAKGYVDSKEMDFFSVSQGYNPDGTTYRSEVNDQYLATGLGSNLQLNLTLSPGQKFVLGLDARRDEFDGASEVRNAETGWSETTRWNPTSNTYGLWGEVKRKATRNLTTIASLRYDRSADYGSFLSPSVGIVLNIGSNSVKLSAGRAFRAPTFNDLFWPGAGNPDLRPESGVAGELRVESSPWAWFYTSASVFKREVTDLISWVPVSEGSKWQPSNVDHLSETGWEFEIKATPFTALSLDTRTTLLTAEQRKTEIAFWDFITGETHLEEKARRAAYVPKIDATTGITFYSPYGAALRGEVRYVGERVNYYPNYAGSPVVTMDEKTLPSALLLGGRVSQRLAPFAEAFLEGGNLLDEEYAEQFGYSMEDRDYPRPGRTLQGGLTLTF